MIYCDPLAIRFPEVRLGVALVGDYGCVLDLASAWIDTSRLRRIPVLLNDESQRHEIMLRRRVVGRCDTEVVGSGCGAIGVVEPWWRGPRT